MPTRSCPVGEDGRKVCNQPVRGRSELVEFGCERYITGRQRAQGVKRSVSFLGEFELAAGEDQASDREQD